jgi:hypothetical protein
MLQNLSNRGLPNVNYGLSVTMPGVNLVGGHQKSWAWRDRVHHPSPNPPVPQGFAGRAFRPARSAFAAVPAVDPAS